MKRGTGRDVNKGEKETSVESISHILPRTLTFCPETPRPPDASPAASRAEQLVATSFNRLRHSCIQTCRDATRRVRMASKCIRFAKSWARRDFLRDCNLPQVRWIVVRTVDGAVMSMKFWPFPMTVLVDSRGSHALAAKVSNTVHFINKIVKTR